MRTLTYLRRSSKGLNSMIVKQGDTRNAIHATLIKNGNPINLENCKVYISIGSLVCNAECMIVDSENGKIAFPLEGFTEKSGIFRYEFTIVYEDGRRETIPNDSYLKLKVESAIKEC